MHAFSIISFTNLTDVQKFATQISHTIQQVNGDVRLNIPHIPMRDPAQIADSPEVSVTRCWGIGTMAYLAIVVVVGK